MCFDCLLYTSETRPEGVGAVCSAQAAEEYGLEVIAADIQNTDNNCTRASCFESTFLKMCIRDSGWWARFFSNHDKPRQVSLYGNDKEYWEVSAKMLAMLLHSCLLYTSRCV